MEGEGLSNKCGVTNTFRFYLRPQAVGFTVTGVVEQVWYDYDLKLFRIDVREAPDGTSTPLSQVGPYSMIHDYSTGEQTPAHAPASLVQADLKLYLVTSMN